MRLAIAGSTALSTDSRKPPSCTMSFFFPGEGNWLVSDDAKDGLAFPQLALFTDGQIDVTVQHVQKALAYTLH